VKAEMIGGPMLKAKHGTKQGGTQKDAKVKENQME
jgi:hypothetical protein